jgi:hypothetical protein
VPTFTAPVGGDGADAAWALPVAGEFADAGSTGVALLCCWCDFALDGPASADTTAVGLHVISSCGCGGGRAGVVGVVDGAGLVAVWGRPR